MTDQQWLEIGKIVAAQGLKGEVRIYPYSDFPERFEVPGQRWLKRDNSDQLEPIDLLKGKPLPGKKLYVVQLDGIQNRDQAEGLQGCTLLVPESDRPSLAEDEFHIVDLIDLDVFDHETKEAVGIVINIFFAGHDLLEVKLHKQPPLPSPDAVSQPKGKKRHPKNPQPITVLIPFVKEIVPIVDLHKRCIEITPPPGLLEMNLPEIS